jgi:hypothetical protein
VQATIDAGVVTLTGAVGRCTAALAERLVADVPGVVAVVNEIRHDFDDSALARSRVDRTNPLSAVPRPFTCGPSPKSRSTRPARG